MLPQLLHATHRGLRLAALAAVTLGLAAGPAAAQEYTVSFGATGGLPINDFGDQLDRVGFGFAGALLYGIGPVAAGVEGGWMTYDRLARPLPAQIDGRSAFLGQAETASRIGHLHALLRLQLPAGPVRPYVDGLVGFQRFATHTRFDQHVVLVSDPVFGFDDSAVDRSITTTALEASDVALSYGVGGGLQVLVARGVDGGTPFHAYLDLGARYLLGEEARYLLDARMQDGDVPLVFVGESRTDLIRPQVSLTVTFGR